VLPPCGSEGGDGDPAHTIVCSAEDDPADTIRPRLEAMGADLRMVHCVESVRYDNLPDRKNHPVVIQRDIAAIAEAIRQIGRVRLIVVDPITAYMGETDGNSNTEVRAVLGDLSRLAAWSGAAVVCVTHLNKDSGGKRAVYRAMGSLAFTAAARVVLLAAAHPDDPAKRVLATVKCNIGPERAGRVYRLVDGRLSWLEEPVPYSANELEMPEEAEKSSALLDACAWLADALKAGPMSVSELKCLADTDEVSWRTVERAKARLGVQSRRENTEKGTRGPWSWGLPA
jgi:putative DNA primase/helicase